VTMEDPGSENDVIAHKLMNEKYGDRVQIVIDDAAVTQLRSSRSWQQKTARTGPAIPCLSS